MLIENVFTILGSIFAFLITIIGFFIKRTLDKIEGDISDMKNSTNDFSGFVSRVDTVLTYHDKEISEIYRIIEYGKKHPNA